MLAEEATAIATGKNPRLRVSPWRRLSRTHRRLSPGPHLLTRAPRLPPLIPGAMESEAETVDETAERQPQIPEPASVELGKRPEETVRAGAIGKRLYDSEKNRSLFRTARRQVARSFVRPLDFVTNRFGAERRIRKEDEERTQQRENAQTGNEGIEESFAHWVSPFIDERQFITASPAPLRRHGAFLRDECGSLRRQEASFQQLKSEQ
jgi:hypothetical protein